MSFRKNVEKWTTDAKIHVLTTIKEVDGKKYVPVESAMAIIKAIENLF